MKRSRQQGIVLVVSMLLLIVLTLFVLSSTRLSTGSLRIIGNVQAKKAADSVAQTTVEQVLSDITPFYSPTAAIAASQPEGMNVTVGNRTCVRATPARGYSAVSGISPEDTFWNVNVAVNDPTTGAATVVNQGVRIRLPAGNCP